MNKQPYFHVKGTDLTKFGVKLKKVGDTKQVTFSSSIRYNGGTIIDGEWYAGYDVDPPILPPGCVLVSIAVGQQLNAHPPYSTQVLKRVSL